MRPRPQPKPETELDPKSDADASSLSVAAEASSIHPVPATRDATPREYDSAELFGGQKLVIISHAGERYRLLITRNGRLILHK